MHKLIRKYINPANKSGFTLVELLVSISITLTITVIALQALRNTQQEFSSDNRNIDKSQKRSSILEIIGRDIRQAGEQIEEPRFPVVKMLPNPVAAKGDSLILYRAFGNPLPLCNTTTIIKNTAITEWPMSSNDTTFTTARQECETATIPAGKTYPRNLQEWVDNKSKSSFAVISNNAGLVQPFTYINQAETSAGSKIFNVSTASFSAPFDLTAGLSAYLVEKKEYLVCGTDLVMRLNSSGEGACPTPATQAQFQIIASNIEEMKVKFTLPKLDVDGTPETPRKTINIQNTTFPPLPVVYPATDPPSQKNYYWKSIELVNVVIRSTKTDEDNCNSSLPACVEKDKKLIAESSFYPRNVMSAKTE